MNAKSARPAPNTLPPLRRVALGPQDVTIETRADGCLLLRSPQTLGAYPPKFTDRLVHWAKVTPDRVLFAQRDKSGGWRKLTYAQALRQAREIGEALLARNLSAERPIAILSGNDIEHALLGLGALYAGIPYAPISPAYSLVSSDLARLRSIFELITPGLVFAADGTVFARAIQSVVPADVEVTVARHPTPGRPTILFDALRATPTGRIDAAHDSIGPDTIAKFLFTSGSTGVPKCVINTQRMWCANQVMLRQAIAYLADEPPVILDWAPWHHTAGGNHDVGLALFNGGTFYIDDGKPMPGAIEETVRNLREIAPTWYFNVPKGFEALLPFLRSDARLRETFFSRVKMLWFAGAALAQHVFEEIQDLAVQACGERILFSTGFGSTETAPFALARTWPTADATNMGLPGAGMELKLVPNDGKLEARVRGPNITPGYWRQPDYTAAAFDDEGFYKLGDCFKFADPDDPKQGLLFDGRIAENFKLATGTWVHVGPMRGQIVDACAPYVRDVVIAGEGRDDVAVLVFPNIDACRVLCAGLRANAAPDIVLNDAGVHAHFTALLEKMARGSTGSSTKVCRALLMTEPPSLDKAEMTDKGSINQRAVLKNRAALVDEIYASAPSPRVIRIRE
ncbi:MAG: feruloyl-CoA synthase [Hyphomicrobiales bacterium]|nr:feruloyl-CoA synthase [Hyphomicrobiales bacterium]